jgi:predicted metal-dependent hydrolase
MDRLQQHLAHIRDDVVPERGAAQAGMPADYLDEIEARAQPPHLVRGLEQWNAGRFYEQHETLEWLWRATDEPVRDALKGIILSGVGALHVQRRNRRGALAKWTGALGYLEPFAGRRPFGIDIDGVRAQVRAARQALLDDEAPLDWEPHLARSEAFHIDWESRSAEPRMTALLRRFDRAWQDSPLSVEANLEGLTEEEAQWAPATVGRTIRDLMIHLGVGKVVSANRCFGDGALAFSAVAAPQAWRKLEAWLVALREPLGFLRDEQLAEPRAMFGGTLSIEHIIEASIEHDFYHAGEINRLREWYRLAPRGA